MRVTHITPADLGVVIAPHIDGPDHGWYFRLDRYQNINDWHGPCVTAEVAKAAAIRWLRWRAACHDGLKERTR